MYLGYTLTDTGLVQKDFDQHILSKRGNSTVEFLNFCRCNFTSPLAVKLKVLEACVNSCYLYGCDVWGNVNCSKIETLHRKALRTALSIRQAVNNEIVYVESGKYPLTCTIQSRQLKFWIKMKTYIESKNESYLSKLVSTARSINLPYLLHYEKLVTQYGSPENCLKTLHNEFYQTWHAKISNAVTDAESKLGVYKSINVDLLCPDTGKIPEFERIVITRYRCGSHYLQIEKGRFQGKKREDRLCSCQEVQTLHHVIFHCPLVNRIPQITTISDFFQLDCRFITSFLKNCEKILHIKSM